LYDPVIGRFVTADSIIPDWYDPQALGRYTCTLNNPIAYIDPDGHAAADWARSWEDSAAESTAGLDQMVSAYSWTWPLAAAVQTTMDVGSGVVDMLKLGEGAAEGGVKGYAQDTMRAVGIVSMSTGTVAKGAQALKGSKILGNEIGAVGNIKAPKIRAESIRKGIPENKLGPSGKPKIHVSKHSTLKKAKDAARARAGEGGTTIKHPTPKKGKGHFHGQKQDGTKIRIHDEYPD